MRITRLLLRNYRVYEDELDLEVPGGLIGIYGPNGAGKSALIEAIPWALYGYARTAKDDVRSAGVNAECVAEVEFEHEGHLYAVRRTLSGVNATVKARAEADGAQVAEGVQAVRQYVHSILGMDAGSFRASVFAEQKQVASFSGLRPAERKDLVLRLLGITPLERARDEARRDARAAAETHDHLRRVLPDLDALEAAAGDAAARAAALGADAAAERAAAGVASAALEAAEACFARLDDVAREHAALVSEGRAVRAEHDAAQRSVHELSAELAELDRLAAGLAGLASAAEGAEAVEARLHLVGEASRALAALAEVDVGEPPPAPDEQAAEAARLRGEEARAALAEATGLLEGARAELDRARQSAATSAALSPEGACPVCGQALGAALEAVRAHRRHEVEAAEARVAALSQRVDETAATAAAATAAATSAASHLAESRRAWAVHERAAQRRATLAESAAAAVARLGDTPAPGEEEALAAELRRRRQAGEECQRAAGRLERRPTALAALEAARLTLGDAGGRLEALREKRRSLDFDEAALHAARRQRDERRAAALRAEASAHDAALAAERARAEAEAAVHAVAMARAQHEALAAAAERSRHLGRVADLLSAFRDNAVATVGPRLSAHAAALFADLTDHEYDRLEVDPATYEIQIRDQGRLFGMDHFSGSETDLANLALRVAIAEHVRLLSGGAVGLLVLDEVFGPLDAERKVRMLAALERLRARFRQVLVVTHDDAIKAELPAAIEVVKRPGRRATARVVAA